MCYSKLNKVVTNRFGLSILRNTMLHGMSVLLLFLSVFTCGIFAWYKPAVNATWAIQYEGNHIDTTLDVDVYDLDGFNTAKTLIDKLHGEGRRVICYFSAGSYENYAPDAQSSLECAWKCSGRLA